MFKPCLNNGRTKEIINKINALASALGFFLIESLLYNLFVYHNLGKLFILRKSLYYTKLSLSMFEKCSVTETLCLQNWQSIFKPHIMDEDHVSMVT